MSAERYSSYTEAFREFRMNISENDFHDDYPETAEMTLAITSGLRYHYIHNYRLLTSDQSIQLIETFAKRCAKLKDYKSMIDKYSYSPKQMIKHKHWSDVKGTGFHEWLLLCYLYGLIDLTYEYKREIQLQFAYMNTWAKRNVIQLKLLNENIKRRIEIQQKLSDSGKLVNRIDEFNHLFKYLHIPSVDLKTGDINCKYVIDSYYDGQVDEKLGTDTIYEWILNDDVNRIQQWYMEGGLNAYLKEPRGRIKNIEFRDNVASHILASKAVGIIRYIIMNHIQEFIDGIHGGWALLDPWRYPVNDPECFRLLQECFREKHESTIADSVNNGYADYGMVGDVYRFIRPEIAEAIYHEITEISSRLYGTDDIYLYLYAAIEMAKFGHIGPIESLDWDIITKTLSDKNKRTIKAECVLLKIVQLMRYRHDLITERCECLPFGMNPSTAVYIHDLFSENGLVRIALSKPSLDRYDVTFLDVNINHENQVVMVEHEEEEWVCTDDELY